MQNINLNEPDIHIIKALKEIKWPIFTNDGRQIFLHKKHQSIEYTINHIAEKRHFLHIRDIAILPEILRNPIKVIPCDQRGRKIYFGKRKGKERNDQKPYLRIVVAVNHHCEYIVTIYPSKNTKEKYLPPSS